MARLYFEYYSKEQDGTKPKYRYCPNCATELQDVVLVHHERRACQHCGFIQHLNPLPGVCIVVEMDGRVLIGRRKSASVLGDRWCLPCGYIDHEESFLEAAHREVLEETNLKIKLTSLMDVSSNHISPTLHSIVPILTATVVEGTATPGCNVSVISVSGLS